jgi:hypothetical protein
MERGEGERERKEHLLVQILRSVESCLSCEAIVNDEQTLLRAFNGAKAFLGEKLSTIKNLI